MPAPNTVKQQKGNEMHRDKVITYIQTCSPSDLLQILDAMIEPVSNYVGHATGIEDTRHEVLLQIQEDEKERVK